jgi:LysM repeat protein
MTLYTLAEKFDMSVSEIKELNAMKDNSLIAFTPIRVRRIGDADIVDPITMERGNVDMKKRDFKKELKRLMAYHDFYDREDPGINLKPGQDFYVVQPQNTLYRISKLYGMSIEDLMKMNGLSSDTIYAGEPIKVLVNFKELVEGEYKVKEKDTIKGVASQFGLKPEELEALNEMHGYTLTANMILKVE